MAPGPILLNSVPKAGTHLLAKVFSHVLGVNHSDIHVNHAFEAARAADAAAGIPKPLRGYAGSAPGRAILRRILLDIAPGPRPLRVLARATGWDGLARAVADLPGSPRRFATAHLPHTPELADLLVRLDTRAILLVRDPRDMIVSYVRYVRSQPDHYLHGVFAPLTEDEALATAIRGLPQGRLEDLGTLYRRFLAWRDCPAVRLTSFERLVGPEGGGSTEAQRQAIGDLARHVGVPCGETELARVPGVFGGTSTFRQGRIGGWRDALTPAHQDAIREVAGDVVDWVAVNLTT